MATKKSRTKKNKKSQQKHAYSLSELKAILEALLPVWDRYNLSEGYALSFFDTKKGPLRIFRGSTAASLRKGKPQPITAHTPIRFASVTKIFTTLLCMQLVSEGKLSFKEQARTYIPELPKKFTFTVWDLLLHIAPIQRDGRISSWSEGQWTETILEDLKSDTFTPILSDKMRYSNFGYGLIGLILERITGMTYGDLATKRIYEPLRMRETWPDANEDFFMHMAKRYSCSRSEVYSYFIGATQSYLYGDKRRRLVDPKRIWRPIKSFAPAAGIVSTMNDMETFVSALGQGHTSFGIKKEIWERCMKTHIKIGRDERGCGIDIINQDGYSFIGHAGGFSGLTSFAFVDPQEGIGLITFMQQSDVAAGNLFYALLDILDLLRSDGRLKTPKKTMSSTELDRYRGVYEGDWDNCTNVVPVRGRLVLFSADSMGYWRRPIILDPIRKDIFIQKSRAIFGNMDEKYRFEMRKGRMCMVFGGEVFPRIS